jgi:putative SOS response-associated peptidase YedK
MCNLYSLTKGPQAIRDFTRAMFGDVGNMPPLPGIFPDYVAPIVRNRLDGRELIFARWGMPVAATLPAANAAASGFALGGGGIFSRRRRRERTARLVAAT